jgi:hypothetical protein
MMCMLTLKSSHRPIGDSRFAFCLQGGGVYVRGGTVTISSCAITGNTAIIVRAHAQNFSSPRWESCRRACPRLTLALLQTLRSTTAGACCRDLENFASPHWETHVLLVFCRAAVSLLSHQAQCPSHRAPSVGTQLQMCASSCSKLPIAPMGDSHVACCLQGGGVFVRGRFCTADKNCTVAISSCDISGNNVRTHAQ